VASTVFSSPASRHRQIRTPGLASPCACGSSTGSLDCYRHSRVEGARCARKARRGQPVMACCCCKGSLPGVCRALRTWHSTGAPSSEPRSVLFTCPYGVRARRDLPFLSQSARGCAHVRGVQGHLPQNQSPRSLQAPRALPRAPPAPAHSSGRSCASSRPGTPLRAAPRGDRALPHGRPHVNLHFSTEFALPQFVVLPVSEQKWETTANCSLN
jgi:hypothetical protein